MTRGSLPQLVPLKRIQDRLPEIFPEGLDHRNYLVREIAAKTIFVMLYAGAVEGRESWIRPNQVTRMTDRQSGKRDAASRKAWVERSLRPGRRTAPGRWYADNTREPIRDETIRLGLMQVDAVYEREGLPTTSAVPRYALRRDFVDLFTCPKKELLKAVEAWRERHLSAGALARLKLVRRGVGKAAAGESVSVTLPNGSVRRMSPGPSSVISKAVIEEFAARFLEDAGVIFLSESKRKVVARDDELAKDIGLDIEASKVLPDIVLVDLGPEQPMLVFVEVVATDGPVSQKRKADLGHLASEAGFGKDDVAYVTAFMDRGTEGVFRRASSEIAWGSFVWFASEPDHILHYDESGSRQFLHEIQRSPIEKRRI